MSAGREWGSPGKSLLWLLCLCGSGWAEGTGIMCCQCLHCPAGHSLYPWSREHTDCALVETLEMWNSCSQQITGNSFGVSNLQTSKCSLLCSLERALALLQLSLPPCQNPACCYFTQILTRCACFQYGADNIWSPPAVMLEVSALTGIPVFPSLFFPAIFMSNFQVMTCRGCLGKSNQPSAFVRKDSWDSF